MFASCDWLLLNLLGIPGEGWQSKNNLRHIFLGIECVGEGGRVYSLPVINDQNGSGYRHKKEKIFS